MRITVSISLANHNASICILKNNKIDLFIQIERLNRKKHSAELNIDAFNIIKKHVNYIDDLILVNFFDESKINLTIETLNKIVKLNDIIVDDDNHHLYHAASAFYLSGFKKATCLVIDGWGTLLNIDNFSGSETTSMFKASYGCKFKSIYKNLFYDSLKIDEFNQDVIEKKYKQNTDCELNISNGLDIGVMYGSVSHYLGFERLEGGKTMGLSSYGKNSNLPNFLYKDQVANMNIFTYNRTLNDKLNPEFKINTFENKANIAYSVQKALEKIFLNKIEYIIKKVKCKNIVLSGGCALNILGNSVIKEKYPYLNLFIDPIANDASLSLGAAKYHYYKRSGDTRLSKEDSIFLGPVYSLKNIKEKIESFINGLY
jgi:carbamoyltransferase